MSKIDPLPLNRSIGFVGGGQMTEALIKGLLASGRVTAGEIWVSEPVPDRRDVLEKTYSVKAVESNRDVAVRSEAVILAVKPQVIDVVLKYLSPVITLDHVVISIAAGVPLRTLEAALPSGTRVVRVMPNTPALVQAGAAAICGGQAARAKDLALVQQIFEAVGTTVLVEERFMDAVTGLSGSGPAYVFTFIEGLIDAGVREGLPRTVAQKLVLQTILGSVRLCQETGRHPSELTAMVTSPGGTTIAGLYALERGGFRGLLMEAVHAAVSRSRELG